MHSLTDLVKHGPCIKLTRINRREAIAAGVATAGLTLLPELRGETPPIPDEKKQYSAEFVATEALRIVEQNLPKVDRAYAGFGIDGQKVDIAGEEYELVLTHVGFQIYDSEQDEITTDRLLNVYLQPCGLALARVFTNQPDLKHLVTRRLEPADKGGVVSFFAFHDFMGLRATIAYTIGDPVNPRPRTLYSLDMLVGVKPDQVKKIYG
jgi:hypothetical protein